MRYGASPGAGRQLTLLARSPAALAAEIGADALAMDWAEEESVRAVLAALQAEPPFQAMISWIHPAGLWCLPDFERLLAPRGRSIRVHGSAAGDPSSASCDRFGPLDLPLAGRCISPDHWGKRRTR
jgi:hypothetical protein